MGKTAETAPAVEAVAVGASQRAEKTRSRAGSPTRATRDGMSLLNVLNADPTLP